MFRLDSVLPPIRACAILKFQNPIKSSRCMITTPGQCLLGLQKISSFQGLHVTNRLVELHTVTSYYRRAGVISRNPSPIAQHHQCVFSTFTTAYCKQKCSTVDEIHFMLWHQKWASAGPIIQRKSQPRLSGPYSLYVVLKKETSANSSNVDTSPV